jgi:hypothetical protein
MHYSPMTGYAEVIPGDAICVITSCLPITRKMPRPVNASALITETARSKSLRHLLQDNDPIRIQDSTMERAENHMISTRSKLTLSMIKR